MPTILPHRALNSIESIVRRLIDAASSFSPHILEQLEQLYELMRSEALAAGDQAQSGAAVARFLTAIDELGEVHAAVGDTIARARGATQRDQEPADAATLIEQLPPTIVAREQAMAAPDEPQVAMPEADAGLPATAPPPDALSSEALTRELLTRPPVPTGPEPTTGAPSSSLTRYPLLDYPREVALDVRSSLIVALELEQSEPASVAVFVADTRPEPPALEVVLRARGFDIDNSNTQLLEVSREEASEVRFVLMPRQLGEQELRVDFYQDGRRIGTVRRAVRVVAQEGALVPVRGMGVPIREPIEIGGVGAVAPDLELCVETDPSDPSVLYFTLHSTVEGVDLHHARAGSVRLQGSPLQKMQQVYDRLSRFAGAPPQSEDARREQQDELARIGRNLWDELVSEQLKAGYAQFKDRVRTLLITSDEPWIPWEIVKPYSFDQHNRLLEDPFWCEQYQLSRWLSGPGPADSVPMRSLRPVAPAVSNLPSVQHELAFLQTIDQLNSAVSADAPFSQRGPVIDLFAGGSFNVLHIAAHGGFNALEPDDSRIMLDGGELRPADIFGRFGGLRPRPLVFINACHGARLEFAFTGLGGWAKRLVCEARVGAFVGSAWEVNDRLALLFAESFYQALLRDNRSLGESFLLARRSVRDADPSNSTWLAYVLYADPGAHVALGPNGGTI